MLKNKEELTDEYYGTVSLKCSKSQIQLNRIRIKKTMNNYLLINFLPNFL